MATIGTILIQAANQAGSITGPNAPSSVGVGGGGSGDDLRSQKKREEFEKKNLEQGEKAPKFWTAAFKKMGIQMGLAGILKQSQIFTSTIGSIFQIFGAFVDVILAPFVPLFIPAIRWLARQLPTVAKAAQWTADKLSKGVSAVWNFLTNGKMWSNVGNFFKNMASEIWDKIRPVLEPIGEVFKTIGTKIYEWVLKPIKEGVKWLWNNSLGGKTIKTWKLSFGFPTWGGGSTGSLSDAAAPPKSKPIAEQIKDKTKLSQYLPFGPEGGEDGWGAMDYGLAGVAGYGGLKATQVGLTSMKGGSLLDRVLGPKKPVVKPTSKVGKVKNLFRRGMGFTDDFELNPLRKIPGTGLLKAGVNIPVKGAELAGKAVLGSGRTLAQAMGLMSGGVDDMAKAAAAGGPTRFGGPGTAGFGDDLTTQPRMAKGASFGDDLAQMKSKGPTKLSNAVQAFNRWIQKTAPKLKNAAGAGANAFKSVYDEGLSLADDVVKIAGKTPGMGFVGQSVSIGFKRVIPGIAGAYMVGETIQDVWKIVKSDVPWIGDWKSLDAYKAEAMNAIFGGGKASAVTPLVGGIGFLTSAAGAVQSKLGFGNDISDWQQGIRDKAGSEGIFSSGKLMDAIVRGGTGITGAALSTFFPGLGTLAGTALYEGGRYATTGLNIPGIEGTVGGNVEKYGEAQDFSSQILKAIEAGWGKGVNMVEIR